MSDTDIGVGFPTRTRFLNGARRLVVAAESAVGDGGNCFIPTAAYGSLLATEVARLRAFWDRYLRPTAPGRVVVRLYALLSLGVAHTLARSKAVSAVVRVGLLPLNWWAGLMLAPRVVGTTVSLGALALAAGLSLGLSSTFRRSRRS